MPTAPSPGAVKLGVVGQFPRPAASAMAPPILIQLDFDGLPLSRTKI